MPADVSAEENLKLLDIKLKQLKLDYEQYFLGSRPREPSVLRGEVQKMIHMYLNNPIQNTAARFRFNSINSRFQAFKRQWDVTLRQIEQGTYTRHVFKANLRGRQGAGIEERNEAATARAAEGSEERLFDAYVTAARSCGQDVSSLTPAKLQAVVRKQETALRKKLGCDSVNFRVVVQDGKVKLKARRG